MVHEGFEIIGPAVAVIDVVRVLPDVAAQDRLAAVHEGAFAVRGLRDHDLAVLDREPAPARPKLRDTGLDEVLLQLCSR